MGEYEDAMAKMDSIYIGMQAQIDEQINRAVLHKLAFLERAAIEIGDYQLATILNNIDKADASKMDQVYANLQEHGYLWEMERPRAEWNAPLDSTNISVSLDLSQMKLRIWKKVIEL